MKTSCDACGQQHGSDRTLFEALRDYNVSIEKISRLEAECAELKVDAERYRWLRDGSRPGNHHEPIAELGGMHLFDVDLDAAIDAAMQAGDKP